MMEKTKTLEVQGESVTVTTEMPAEGKPVTIRAECDGVVAEHTLTVGPAEGPYLEDYDEAKMQRDLNAARQKIAATVVWKVRARRMLENVR